MANPFPVFLTQGHQGVLAPLESLESSIHLLKEQFLLHKALGAGGIKQQHNLAGSSECPALHGDNSAFCAFPACRAAPSPPASTKSSHFSFPSEERAFFPERKADFEASLPQNGEPAAPGRLSGDAGRVCPLLPCVTAATTQILAWSRSFQHRSVPNAGCEAGAASAPSNLGWFGLKRAGKRCTRCSRSRRTGLCTSIIYKEMLVLRSLTWLLRAPSATEPVVTSAFLFVFCGKSDNSSLARCTRLSLECGTRGTAGT